MKLATKSIVEEYVLGCDRGSPEPTVFTIRSLDDKEVDRFFELLPRSLQRAADLASATPGRELASNELVKACLGIGAAETRDLVKAFVYICTAALVRTRGLLDEEDKPLDDIGAAEFVRQLLGQPGWRGVEVLCELGSRIAQITQLAIAYHEMGDRPTTLH